MSSLDFKCEFVTFPLIQDPEQCHHPADNLNTNKTMLDVLSSILAFLDI